ncbi:hypothetical protein O3P69_002827 [Scylla paramamosain]|uniref:MOB kinase activator 2 n=2 Tax=Scylla paramamosain TaxID=85552 RepID=A0AAW0UNQ2_SCYPA
MVTGASWGSWDSWGSESSCSSWHSACGPQDPGADKAPLWSSPTPAPWPPPQDSPWSLPVGLTAAPSEAAQAVRAAQARRPSVVAALLSLQEAPNRPSLPRSASAPADRPLSVDASAFSRYYEDSVVCPRGMADDPAAPEPVASPCGGPLSSLALVLPGRLEGLVKLLAHSLHLLLAAVCSRKARRQKDRECSAAQEQEHKLYLEEAVLKRKIPETDLRQLVELPPGLGYEEWLASHTIDFFQHINLVYGTVCEFCTMGGCPDMTGPATRQYLWFDEKGKKTRVAAPQYVDYVMTFTQKTINDESIFPTKFENDFPVSFESIVKKIQRLLFHVLAHLYHSHFREVVLLNLHAHLNCIFAHFILFNDRFRLIEEKETEILHDLVVALRLHPESEGPSPIPALPTDSECPESTATTREGESVPAVAPSEEQPNKSEDGAAVSEGSGGGAGAGAEEEKAGGSGPPLLAGEAPDTRP